MNKLILIVLGLTLMGCSDSDNENYYSQVSAAYQYDCTQLPSKTHGKPKTFTCKKHKYYLIK